MDEFDAKIVNIILTVLIGLMVIAITGIVSDAYVKCYKIKNGIHETCPCNK